MEQRIEHKTIFWWVIVARLRIKDKQRGVYKKIEEAYYAIFPRWLKDSDDHNCKGSW